MIVGHERVVSALSAHLPPTTLLQGPHGVGVSSLSAWLAHHHGYKPIDVVGGPQRLDSALAEEIIAACQRRPVGRAGRLVRASLDGASSQSVNALLKVLEEPPGRTKFILTASSEPLLTIRSRCHVYRLGLLSEVELATVLIDRLGYDEHRAYRLAAAADGTVDSALRMDRMEGSKTVILSALRAVHEDDVDLLGNALRNFDDDAVWMLRKWSTEARTGRWGLFTAEESYGLDKDTRGVDAVRAIVSTGGRPRLSAALALDGWRRSRVRAS